MNEVFEFLKGKTFYIATVDGNQPKLRPFGGVAFYDDKIYFSTNNKKQVYAQMIANPKIEIVALDKGEWIRVSGVAKEDKSREAKQAMFDASPYLQNQYSLEDDVMAVFYIDNMKATLNGFGGKVDVLVE